MKITDWSKRVLRVLAVGSLVAMLVLVSALPVSADTTTVQMQDTFTITCRTGARDIDGVVQTGVTTATLIVADDTVATKGVITNATLAVPGYVTIAVAGYVGRGNNSYLSLYGASTDSTVILTGRVRATAGVVSSISGTITGTGEHSQGTLGDDPAGATATWSVAAQYNGTTSALLTQAAVAGSTYVQFTPPPGIRLKDLDTITTGWSLAYKQAAVAYGPQVELRFISPTNTDPDGVGHVDVTCLIYQGVGTAAWVVGQITGAATYAGYYGNDPTDGTAFDEFSGTLHLADIEAAINAEAVMIAGGDSASNWRLSRVRVELWEAGARTCYVDDVTIKNRVYSFEPVAFSGSFTGRP